MIEDVSKTACEKPSLIMNQEEVVGSIEKGAFKYFKFKLDSESSPHKIDICVYGMFNVYFSSDNENPKSYDYFINPETEPDKELFWIEKNFKKLSSRDREVKSWWNQTYYTNSTQEFFYISLRGVDDRANMFKLYVYEYVEWYTTTSTTSIQTTTRRITTLPTRQPSTTLIQTNPTQDQTSTTHIAYTTPHNNFTGNSTDNNQTTTRRIFPTRRPTTTQPTTTLLTTRRSLPTRQPSTTQPTPQMFTTTTTTVTEPGSNSAEHLQFKFITIGIFTHIFALFFNLILSKL